MGLEQYNAREVPLTFAPSFLRQEFSAIARAIPGPQNPITFATLPTGSGSWDSGAGSTITITRSLTVAGTLSVGGQSITAASTAARAGISIPSGTAPSSPVDGEFWYDGTNLKFRNGGATRTLTWV